MESQLSCEVSCKINTTEKENIALAPDGNDTAAKTEVSCKINTTEKENIALAPNGNDTATRTEVSCKINTTEKENIALAPDGNDTAAKTEVSCKINTTEKENIALAPDGNDTATKTEMSCKINTTEKQNIALAPNGNDTAAKTEVSCKINTTEKENIALAPDGNDTATKTEVSCKINTTEKENIALAPNGNDTATRTEVSCKINTTEKENIALAPDGNDTATKTQLSCKRKGDACKELNLLTELKDQGLQKDWSPRQKRFCYWNRKTDTTQWHSPTLNSLPECIANPPPSVPSKNSNPRIDSTLQQQLDNPALQWNFQTTTNVMRLAIPPTSALHAHPKIEFLRAYFTRKLYMSYEEQCLRWHCIQVPDYSFQAWLMEVKIFNNCDLDDPLLPTTIYENPFAITMFTTILQSIPFQIVKPVSSEEAREQLNRYLKAAKKMIHSDFFTKDVKAKLVTDIDLNIAWIHENPNGTIDDYENKFNVIKEQCQPLIIESVKGSVKGQCSTLTMLSSTYSQRIRTKHLETIGEGINDQTIGVIRPQQIKNVYCQPISFNMAPPQMPVILFQKSDSKSEIILSYRARYNLQPDSQRINLKHFHKLEQLYHCNCLDDKDKKKFLARVWCLLKRYESLSSEYKRSSPNSAQFLQASLPISVFKTLHIQFGVTFECFASPINCYFREFCSAFIDTDGYFGSQGSFFSFIPVSGSFQVNPPPIDGFINATFTHIDLLLTQSQEPLSFIVFLPERKVPKKINDNHFMRHSLTITGEKWKYRHGYEHLLPESNSEIRSTFGIVVFWLQNDSGFNRWEPTMFRIKEFQQSFLS